MKTINLNQQDPDWFAWRDVGIGSSDVAAILGLSKFSTAYQLYLDKKGLAPRFKGNPATQAGNAVEGKARAIYEMTHGDFESFEPICIEHDSFSFMRASLDGYSDKLRRIVEIKYPSEQSHQMALNGEVPEQYMIQIQYQLAICDKADHAHYFSYRENNSAMVVIRRDLKFINEILMPAVVAFKGLLDSNTPPPLTDKDAKWMDDEDTLLLFEDIKNSKDKKYRSFLADRIISFAKHPKVRTPKGLITSVRKNGQHSFYKITLPKETEAPEPTDASIMIGGKWWNHLGEIESQKKAK